MNELMVVASETHEKAIAYFKVAEQYGYKFIMEVKKIRDERLYRELGFTNFDDYCDSAWKTVRRSMDERIQIADSFGSEQYFESTYSHLGHTKSLMLARMEPEARQQIEATVNVVDTTVKDLKDILRKTEDDKQRHANESHHYKKLWEQEKDKPALVTTKEVIPPSLKKQVEDLQFQNTNLSHGLKTTSEELQKYKLRDTVDFNEELSKKELAKLQQEADLTTVNIRIAYKNFIEKAGVTGYLQGALATASHSEKERLSEMVETALQIITQTQLALRGRKLGVVNE